MSHGCETLSTPDGLRLHLHRWLPKGNPKAVVIIVHGFCEHGGRYGRMAVDLYQHDYAVYAADLRGHGRSLGQRAWVRRFDEYLDDLQLVFEHVAHKYPQLPLFLFGHSMGGAIATLYCLERKPLPCGLILSGPALLIAADVFPWLRRLAALGSALCPRLRIARMGCRYLSRDEQVVEAFKNDPFVFHERFPIRTGNEVLRAAKRIESLMPRLTLPLLILHGTGDRVADPQGSRRLHDEAASTDKTLQLYEGLYHEVLSEPEREQVLGDLLAWLDARS